MTVAIRPDKLGEKDIELIGQLIKSKIAPCHIARKFSVKTDDIRRICTALGLPPTGFRVRKDYTDVNAKIRHMVKSERYSQKFISEALGVDRTRVFNIQAELGYLVNGSAYDAKIVQMEARYRRAKLLTDAGSTIKDACKAVGGISQATYTRHNKKAANV